MKNLDWISRTGFCFALFLLGIVFLLSSRQAIGKNSSSKKEKLSPPETHRVDVVEVIHGQKVADPYRWLEEIENEEVQAWIKKQNDYSRSILDKIEGRDKITKRLRELLSVGSISTPIVRNNRYFYQRREGLQNQPVLYVRDGLKGKSRALIDPNALSKEGLTSLDWWYPSQDGKLLAYGLSQHGDEWSTLYILNVDTGEKLKEGIPRTRYCSLAWLPDNSGFYYTRYPKPGTVPPGEENYNRHLYFHKLGKDYHEDIKIFGEGRDPRDLIIVSLSPDGRYMLLIIYKFATSEIFFCDLKEAPGKYIPVITGVDALSLGTIYKNSLFILTNLNAPNYTLYSTSVNQPEKENWKQIISEGEGVLQDFNIIGDKIFVNELRNATTFLKIYSLTGQLLSSIELPTLGSASTPSGEWNGQEAFFFFQSFFYPPTAYRYDLKTEKLSIFDQIKINVDSSNYESKQVYYTSKDGTKISMFIVHRKGLKLNGSNPTLLTGYGGFNISLTPMFQGPYFFWLEHGGVLAIPNLRGGGEYGEKWHKAGMLGNKQNVFDDFVAAAEWLINKKYTNPRRLAIAGGSNGGLLMGAVLTQRPDLFAAVYCAVPLLDMIRYHHFSIAKLWIPEYGSSEDPEQFKWLYAYSPYHHVKKGTKYPAVLFTTAESDSRVDPMHAMKMAAYVQYANASDNPILLWVEPKAGHGVGKPVEKIVAQIADIYSFFCWRLGVSIK